MFPVRIETERLLLREFLPTDVERIHAYASDPEVVRYEVWGPNTLTDSERFLASVILPAQSKEPRAAYELAIELTGTGIIGGCGMRIKDVTARTADLGYVLSKAHWGKGYMPEAIAAFLHFGFTALGLHRIWATTDTRNVQSNRVLEKVGMRREGRRRADQLRRGTWVDSYLYAVLEHEWRARSPRTDSVPVSSARRATQGDFEGITELLLQVDELHRNARPDLFRTTDGAQRASGYIGELLANDDALVLVVDGAPARAAAHATGLAGFAVAFLRNVAEQSVMAGRRHVLLDGLAVHRSQRRAGVGTTLARAVEEWAKERGAASIELGVHEFNAGAQAFYEKLGYDVQWRRMEKRL